MAHHAFYPNSRQEWLFTESIDSKFAQVSAGDRGPSARAHEELLPIRSHPLSVFRDKPGLERAFLQRPIPGQAEAATTMWPRFNGHRVTLFFENNSSQIDYYAANGEIYRRTWLLACEGSYEQLASTILKLRPNSASPDLLAGLSEAEIYDSQGAITHHEHLSNRAFRQLLSWISKVLPAPEL
jgi:hypothetical protein